MTVQERVDDSDDVIIRPVKRIIGGIRTPVQCLFAECCGRREKEARQSDGMGNQFRISRCRYGFVRVSKSRAFARQAGVESRKCDRIHAISIRALQKFSRSVCQR